MAFRGTGDLELQYKSLEETTSPLAVHIFAAAKLFDNKKEWIIDIYYPIQHE